ncbi:MAG: tetratricopeptide repeat protein [Rhodobacteraceae bacterium]|jgi:Flp pilus assembly protein TadD|nr:tetratricopeptide repeat protein [Paracoccaceae bacterium]
MKQARPILNALVAATLAFGAVCVGPYGAVSSARAQTGEHSGGQTSDPSPDIDALLRDLARPDQERWVRIERQILRYWARSGSAAIDYLFGRGQAALQAGQAEDAIAHFSVVIDHDPDFAEAWNGRATAYFMVNRLGQSMSDIEQVLIRNPRHFGALAGLGMILEQLERPEEAREAFAASLAIHPHQASVIEALARLDLATAGAAL